MITVNVDKSDKLTNGQRGHIVDIDPTGMVVWVKFQDSTIGVKKRRVFKEKHESAIVPVDNL